MMSRRQGDLEDPKVSVAALVTRGEELLMVRHGHGPAGGFWDVPLSRARHGETLAESVLRTLDQMCGLTSGLCGPFEGWEERIDLDAGVHELIMYFRAVLLDDDVEPTPDRSTAGAGSDDVAEVAWVSTFQVVDLRTRDGLAEFLSDQSIIDTVA